MKRTPMRQTSASPSHVGKGTPSIKWACQNPFVCKEIATRSKTYGGGHYAVKGIGGKTMRRERQPKGGDRI